MERITTRFVGILHLWWEHIAENQKERIIHPGGIGDPLMILIESLYKEFVGTVENQTELALDAFHTYDLTNRAIANAINSIYAFMADRGSSRSATPHV